MDIINERDSAKNKLFELIDIDGYFCLFSEKRLMDVPEQLYSYSLKKANGKITEIRQDHINDKEFGGFIISKIPIYMNSTKTSRSVKNCCEHLGVYSTIFGYSGYDARNTYTV